MPNQNCDQIAALKEAIEVLGGEIPFASALVVSWSRISYWLKTGNVPPEFCPTIERLTTEKGDPVVCERLAPGVEWDYLRQQVEEE